MEASVSTRVVSWNDAAEMNESVESEAFVMPRSSGRPVAGLPPSLITRSFSSRNANLSSCSSSRNRVSPTSSTFSQDSENVVGVERAIHQGLAGLDALAFLHVDVNTLRNRVLLFGAVVGDHV